MTKYQILLAAKQSGLMKLLCSEFGFPTHYNKWIKIYSCHLEHPRLSQQQVAEKFNVSQRMVSEVYSFVEQELTDADIFLEVIADWICRINVVISQSDSTKTTAAQP